MKKRRNNIEESYNRIISRGFITVLIYFCISVLWILYSDWIVELITKDYDTLNRIQSFKGIAFVVMTSIFMLVIVQRYNSFMTELKQAYVNSENHRKDLIIDNQKNKLFKILTSYLTGDYETTRDVVLDVFNYIFDRTNACDQASVFQVGHEYVEFIEVVGYDLKNLNSIQIPAEKIELYTFGVNKSQNPENGIEKRLGPARYQEYKSKNPPIHESIYIGIIDLEEMKYGMSLDISVKQYQETRATFSDDIIKELRDIQFLMTSMFRIKNMVDMKHIIQSDLVSSFIAALEYHDEYTKGHSVGVATIANGIGRELHLGDEELDELHWASMIHDLGKIVIPKDMLNKPGALTDEEFELIRKHSENGEAFLNQSKSLITISKYVRHHHERYDGNGYPDGLKGEEIPLLARIITVADSYHAMTSERPYKNALSHEKALAELINNDGTQFCPIVLEAFLKMNDKLDV